MNKSIAVFFIRVLSIILSFYFIYIITQLYGAEGLGIFVLSQSILMILSLFSVFGVDTALLKFVSHYIAINDYSKIKSVYLVSLKFVIFNSIACAIIILIFKEFLAVNIFNDLLFQKLFGQILK